MSNVLPIGPGLDERRQLLVSLRAAVEVLQGQVGDCLEAVEALESAGPGGVVLQLRPPHRPRAG
jgi:hypothetical protein